MSRARRRLRALLPLAIGAVPLAEAGDWRITPRFNASETWTDNLDLVSSGGSSDYVTRLSPGVNVTGQGRRLRGSLDYTYSRFIYLDRSDANRDGHQVQGRGTAELLPQWFFIEGALTRSEQVVNRQGRLPNSVINITNNTAEVSSLSVSPYLRHAFGGFATGELRYRWTDTATDAIEGQERTAVAALGARDDVYEASLASGEDFRRLPWRLSWSRRESEREAGATDRIERKAADLTWVYSRRWRATATVGQEDNSFLTQQGGDASGFIWTLGGTWTPSPRTTLSMNFGERFFGSTFGLNLTQRRKRWVFNTSYREEVQTFSQREEALRLFPTTDAFGQPVTDPLVGATPVLVVDRPSLVDDVSVSRILNSTATWVGRRTTATVSVGRDLRELQGLGSDEEVSFWSGRVSHRVTPLVDASLAGQYSASEFGVATRTDRRYEFTPALNWRIARSLTGALSYSWFTNESDVAENDFTENRVVGSLSITF